MYPALYPAFRVSIFCLLLIPAVSSAAEYRGAKTFWGQPDLQGVWTNATFTTLERPEDVDGLVLSEAQARAMVSARNEFYDNYDDPEKVDGKLAAASDPGGYNTACLLYTSPSPRDRTRSRMPSSA